RRVVGREGRDRVLERLALVDGGPGRLDADDVGGEPLGGQLERGERAGARFVEEVDDGAPAQGRHLLDVAAPDLGEALSAIEDALDLLAREMLNSEQVLHASSSRLETGGSSASPAGRPRIDAAAGVIATSSAPSVSSSRTLTRSPGAVGRFL